MAKSLIFDGKDWIKVRSIFKLSRGYLGFAAKSLLVGLGVGRLRVSSRSFQALLPCFFVPVCVL
ncbi:MAG: hypothetical protein EWV55_18590 [Microcystis viridis Mv_BB_P_19951000_S69]|uniref:Uncharacterized protein n=1 Tax=Microcystis viridis Mv_BB_P_19951000_S68D TaxID=2486270 RepID=A0A552HKY9_MICVR|nr:MAG: hypothetical protein EWV47_23610 [Microcystis viridis Mv_BB_P_19951000_S68]TRU70714.1 MAG: hypothetical protein EWV55_18590 [Microcystis viridis Mv_BB_P_19951000_S69]TRU71862.1 MAG: hypothetical protein EWV77_14580 [Microcystis viridis Mv_BB_P_19951000_S68D]TRU81114.1 MAG: hypothetical protein EWV46_21685 [Microcystis viridis Mv_BB_P_19951000_S69D]